MAYRKRSLKELAVALLRQSTCLKFWKTVARAAMDYDFDHANQLQSISLDALVASCHSLKIVPNDGEWGETPLIDLIGLCALVSLAKPQFLFEFGTFTGNATVHMLRNADPVAHVHTLDLPPDTRKGIPELLWEKHIDDDIIGSRFRDTPDAERITQWRSDTRTFDTSSLRKTIDFVWIDACHEYDFVKNDTEKALEMITPGGTIAWHDYSHACPGVVRYLTEFCKRFPVTRIERTQVAFVRT